jgi:threonyl-tRNA synthetase
MNNQPNIKIIRHSLAHIMMQALSKRYQAIPGIGPEIENGFYHDFESAEPITENDLKQIEKDMKHIIKQNLPIERQMMKIDDGIKLLEEKKYLYTAELAKELKTKGETEISFYTQGEFINMCTGPHLERTKDVNLDAFKLTKIAGAYWRGDEKNKMLQRIYGVAFETKEELDKYFENLKEAEQRDHRKVGKKLDLFHIDEKVGLGLPLWHPKGAMLWRLVEDFWYQEHLKNGYSLVRSPHIGNRTLWETSGHWGFYNDSMYPPMEAGQNLEEKQKGEKVKESEEYLLKPMNCPFHVQIYKNSPKSYRELPLRWAECGTVYRFEKKGELSGLTRVRGFTQDDAHIVCRADQVETELKKVVDFILFIFKSFGFDIDKISVYLSLRDPNNKAKYSGSDEGWDFTENVLRKVAVEKKLNFTEEKGEAAFYGPKLDFKIKDVLGREWQCSTLQFDFNLPNRFEMSFVNNEGKDEKPYMLHRALFGSFERFLAVLIEHYAGAFPLWLSPTQVAILPISDKFIDYANGVADSLRQNNIRVEVDARSESLGKKIREAEMQKTPYMVVVGEKEQEAKKVRPRHRKEGDIGELEIVDFIELLKKEIINKEIR